MAPKTLRDRFGGVDALTNFLGIGETPPGLDRSFKGATKLRRKLPTDIKMKSTPLTEISSLVEDIHYKTREAAQNTVLDM